MTTDSQFYGYKTGLADKNSKSIAIKNSCSNNIDLLKWLDYQALRTWIDKKWHERNMYSHEDQVWLNSDGELLLFLLYY